MFLCNFLWIQTIVHQQMCVYGDEGVILYIKHYKEAKLFHSL